METTNTFAIPYLQQALQLNNTLIGLPMMLLAVIGCMALACLLFALPFVKNRFIPGATIVTGIALNLGGTPLTTWEMGVRSTIMGLLAGVAAWIIFKKFGQKWVSPELFKQNGDTETVKKDGGDAIPPI